MKTSNNIFTMIQRWTPYIKENGSPPRFYKQSFNVRGKVFTPFDELKKRAKEVPKESLIPHFFIADAKQSCFISNPKAHSDVLNKVFATFSTDYSVPCNGCSEFNNAIILLNRAIASNFQMQGRFVILTMSWGGYDTYDMAFNNIDEGCIVGVSTVGVKDLRCFDEGFREMIRRVKPVDICWYGSIPKWVEEVYPLKSIIFIPKRSECVRQKLLRARQKGQMFFAA